MKKYLVTTDNLDVIDIVRNSVIFMHPENHYECHWPGNKDSFILTDAFRRVINKTIKYHPDWLQLIQQKDWEILFWDMPGDEKHPISKIKTVKRLSDGEEFSVGDKIKNFVSGYEDDFIVISKFEVDCNKLWFYRDGNPTPFNFSKIKVRKYIEQQKPTPLLTTEDGVDIYDENEELWDMSDVHWVIFGKTEASQFIVWRINGNINRKCWKHKENAKKYIEENKPQFSKNDILDFARFSGLRSELHISDAYDHWLKGKK